MGLLNDFQTCSTELEAWGFAFVFFVFGVVIYGLLDSIFSRNDNYRQGQIDALNGKIKYEKTVNKDGEIVWVEIIDEPKNQIMKHP